MKTNRGWLIVLLVLSWAGMAQSQTHDAATTGDSSERHFDLLKVGELSFTNVWVHRQTNFNILIRHNGGIHTIKLTDLPEADLAELKSQIGHLAVVENPEENPKGNGWLEKARSLLKEASPRTLVIAGSAAVLVIALLFVVFRRDRARPTE